MLVVLKTDDAQVQVQAALVVLGDMLAGLSCFVNVREGRRQHGGRQGKG